MSNVKYNLITIANPTVEIINLKNIDFDYDSLIVDGVLFVPDQEEGSERFTRISIDSEIITTKTISRRTLEKEIKKAIENEEDAFVLRNEDKEIRLLNMHDLITMYIDYLEKNKRLS